MSYDSSPCVSSSVAGDRSISRFSSSKSSMMPPLLVYSLLPRTSSFLLQRRPTISEFSTMTGRGTLDIRLQMEGTMSSNLVPDNLHELLVLQPLPFVCLFNPVIPWYCEFHHKDLLGVPGPQQNIWAKGC